MSMKLLNCGIAVMFLVLVGASAVFGDDTAKVRAAAQSYAKPLETIMVDGPFYVGGRPYYVADYIYGGEIKSSLVYDINGGSFIADSEILKKVYATQDLALPTLLDPLFYAPGDYSAIPLAAKYETQNVRNFAELVPMSFDERIQLEKFLQTYERAAEDIAIVNRITDSILYPEGSFAFSYSYSSPHLLIDVKEPVNRNFSYEAFQELLAAYSKVSSDYEKLISELVAFSRNVEAYPVDTPIREKWGIVITTENVKEQIALTEENRDILKKEIEIRSDISSQDYEQRIKDVARISTKAEKTYVVIFVPLVLAAYYMFRKKRPPKIMLMLALLMSVAQAASVDVGIPTPQEMLSQKVKSIDNVQIRIFAKGLEESKAKRILFGYPLLLEGEDVEVRGPYYIRNTSYYLYEIAKDGMHTGNGFLIDAETERLEADQQLALQVMKARFVSELIQEKPLYTVSEDEIAQKAAKAGTPMDSWLGNLSSEVREGKRIEQKLTETPDFEQVKSIVEHYTRTFMLLRNIEGTAGAEEAAQLTAGLSSKRYWFEAYARAMKGLSAEEYLVGRSAMYRGRTLNRLPIIRQVAAIGYEPSLPQLIQDLTNDLIYDNYFLWRLGRVSDVSLFVRLPYKEGTVTSPTALEDNEPK